MKFKQLATYKKTILDLLVKSENISKALINKDENFLDIPITINPTSLVYKNIFPYKKIPKITDEPKTYITMRIGGFKLHKGVYKVGYVLFYVFAHESLLKTDMGTRVDYMISEIDEIFNENGKIFANRLAFDGMDEIEFPNDYYGSWIRYKGMDFN